MGLIDELFGKKEVDEALKTGSPFKMKLSFSPLRVTARKNNSADLVIEFQNITKEALLVSLVVSTKSGLGLDSMGLNKAREMRVGYMKDGEEKTVRVPIYGSTNTAPGTYAVDVSIMAHYRDYGHVLNSVRKSMELRVV